MRRKQTQGVVIRYDAKSASEDDIIFRLAAPDIVAVEFKLQTIRVLQTDVRYNGGPECDSEVFGHCKQGDVRGADDSAFGKFLAGWSPWMRFLMVVFIVNIK